MKFGNMEIETKIENPRKVAVYLAVTAVCIGYTVFNLIGGKPKTVQPNDNSPAEVSQLTEQPQDGAENAVIRNDSQNQTGKDVIFAGDITSVNPFIEMSTLSKAAAQTASNASKVSNTAHFSSSAPVGNIPLPQIPNMQGRLPQVGTAAMPSGNIPAAPAASASSVQGVLTGGSGKNMAIMSNGQVVSEGDTFQDGRIAYIGGDGVHFEDGHVLGYK